VDQTIDRPYLIPAIGVAAGITLVGAIEAFIKARGRRAEQEQTLQEVAQSGTIRLTGPTVAMRGGRVDVSFVGLRFD